MRLKRCKGKRRSGILALLVIVSISLAVLAALAALATLSPVVSAGVTAEAWINPSEVTLGNITKITLQVSTDATEPEDVSITYVLSDNITYVGNPTNPPDDIIENRTLIWLEELTSAESWTTSFDVEPITLGYQPVSIALLSIATCNGSNMANVTIEGTLDVTPGANPDFEFSITYLQNGTISFITRDDLMPYSNFTGYSGEAIHIHVRPKQQTKLEVDGLDYDIYSDKCYDIWSDSMTVNLYKEGAGAGKWRVDIDASNATFSEYGSEALFPQLFVNVTAPEISATDISAPDGRYIGQPVGITGHALLKNTGNDANVIVKLYVDGFLLRRTVITVPHIDDEKDFNVPTTWIPMSSGLHSISMQVYLLSYDETEFWTEAQGPNEATNSTTIYIRRVR
jgi:hypothetical protein